MTARALVVGLDGADRDLVGALGPEVTPTLHALMQRGAHAALRSVQPPATLPNWTTFLTGVGPGKHGVFDFTTRDRGRVRFTAGTVREASTIFARLDRLGLACACVGFPATWPPERLQHGVFLSGWDAPVAFEADRSFVWPPALYDAIVERFGAPRFDDVDEFDAGAPGWYEALPGALVERIGRKADLAEWLLRGRAWDAFAFYFGESDTAGHHLWAHHDPRSPRHAGVPPDADRAGIARVYRALDEALARLLEAAGPETEVTVVSDHGFGGAGDKVLYLNRALAEAGLLGFHPHRRRGALIGAAKDWALTGLPPRLRERVFRFGGAALPSWLETQARFGGIDFEQTVAFSDELNYFPAVWLNLEGRERRGIVSPAQRAAVTREVSAALRSLRDPWTGAAVVAEVWPREELYEGPWVERAPDLILRLHLDRGYSYNLMPSATAPPGTGPWRRLDVAEHLGRKGRSLPGSHRERGLFVAAGPRVAPIGEVDAAMADVPATLLARLNVAVPPDADGRVLWELLCGDGARPQPLPSAPVVRGAGDEARVEARLRALGYID